MEDEGNAQRRAAAERAVEAVRDGMVLGFGTGRAAAHALEALARRAAQGLRVSGVPSSRATEARARELGLTLTSLDQQPHLDLTIDGADEVDPARHLIKGGGGALLREKILAAAADRLIIVVESSKLVPYLGATRGVPLEVLPFGWASVARRLEQLGGQPELRRTAAGEPAVSDNGNWVIDCVFSRKALGEPGALDRQLHAIPGLLETGLFWSFNPTVVVGEPGGARVLAAAPT